MKTLTESVTIYVYTNGHFYRNKTLNVFSLLSGDIEVCLKYCIENVISGAYQLAISIFSESKTECIK